MEDTITLWMDLRDGEDYAFLPECNVLGLSRRLRDDPCAIDRVISQFQNDWRRNMLRIVS